MSSISWSLEQGYTNQQIKHLETLERFCEKATHMKKEDPRFPTLMQKINELGATWSWNESLPLNDRLTELRQTFSSLQVVQLNASTTQVAEEASSSIPSVPHDPLSVPITPPDDACSVPLGPIHCLDENFFSKIFCFLRSTSAIAASKVCHAWEPLNRSLLWNEGREISLFATSRLLSVIPSTF